MLMARKPFPRDSVVPLEEGILIPAGTLGLDEFRRWCEDERFPERGRIDYLQGDLEIDLSPEELFTHGTAKSSIGARLHALIVERGLGFVFIDRARVVSPAAGLSVEPDVVVVLRDSIASGRVRLVPSSRRAGRYVELEGAPDLVVEIVSDASVSKDRDRLPRLYAQAGVPELWLADARGDVPLLEIRALGRAGYARVAPDGPAPKNAEGWTRSPLLGRRFRLRRREVRDPELVYHELETRP